jgi:hypothetical protein
MHLTGIGVLPANQVLDAVSLQDTRRFRRHVGGRVVAAQDQGRCQASLFADRIGDLSRGRRARIPVQAQPIPLGGRREIIDGVGWKIAADIDPDGLSVHGVSPVHSLEHQTSAAARLNPILRHSSLLRNSNKWAAQT